MTARRRGDGSVRFFHGPMNCGKSTMALQVDYNQRLQGRRGVLLTRLDRSGGPQVTSRLGLDRPAVEVGDTDDLRVLARDLARSTSSGPRTGTGPPAPSGAPESWDGSDGWDYVVVDEAQFFTPAHIDQLAELADRHGTDCHVFGLATDFRGRLFPASARLFEIADVVTAVPVDVLCWCGRPARFNARVVGHRRVLTGSTVVLGDTSDEPAAAGLFDGAQVAGPVASGGHYQVLCRRHHRDGRLGPGPDPLE